MWMKTIQQDLKSNNLSLNEAIEMAQNHPFWRLMSMFGAMHSLLVHATHISMFHRVSTQQWVASSLAHHDMQAPVPISKPV